MEFYCDKDQHTGNYKHFFKSEMSVRMCGVKKEKIVQVSVLECESEPEQGSEENKTYWAYKDLEKNELRFIFKSEIQVKMCSDDFFQSNIKKGIGKIVPVNVKETP